MTRELNRALPHEPIAWLKEACFGALCVATEDGGSSASLPQFFKPADRAFTGRFECDAGPSGSFRVNQRRRYAPHVVVVYLLISIRNICFWRGSDRRRLDGNSSIFGAPCGAWQWGPVSISIYTLCSTASARWANPTQHNPNATNPSGARGNLTRNPIVHQSPGKVLIEHRDLGRGVVEVVDLEENPISSAYRRWKRKSLRQQSGVNSSGASDWAGAMSTTKDAATDAIT